MASRKSTSTDRPSLGSLRVQLYRLRACFHGTLHWTCPWCANHNSSTLMPDYYIIDCTGSRYATDPVSHKRVGNPRQCKGKFVPSITLRPTPMGSTRIPADYRIPLGSQLTDSFPSGELNVNAWRWGERVHELYGAERVKELDAVRRFIERAEAAGVGRLESARMYLENEVAMEERGLVE